jgi:tryptophan halogenase
MPDTQILFEPRFGFNYDLYDDATTQFRGGTGIFTGRPPAVFLSNAVGNNGVLTGFVDASGAALSNMFDRFIGFVFDCSVFKRLILNGVFPGELESVSEYLTVNSAIPFFLERNDPELNTTTRAIAMKHGWMWMIPLQHRWGCGYVYDDKYITQEEAVLEVENYLGYKILNERLIKFNAGCYKEVWKKNTISIGLSTGFIEPLEATSIMTAVKQLFLLDNHLLDMNSKKYNESTYEMNEENMLFIFYHYICGREDSGFWLYYKNKELIPGKLHELIDDNLNIKLRLNNELKKIFKNSFTYTLNSWLVVDKGAKGIKKLL